jgi:hypothetical protein
MMPRIGRLLALLAIPALAASVAMAPAASGQSPSAPPPECALLTVDEVADALALTTVELSSGSPYYCSFTGDTYLYVVTQPGSDLERIKTENPGGIDLTVGGRPAWFVADSGSLWVDADGQVLGLSSYGGEDTAALQAGLVALAELALPRLPAGPSAEDVARLEGLVPDTIGDEPVTTQTFTGEMLLGFMEPDDPDVRALSDALAAQGKTPADIVIVSGNVESDSDLGILVGQVKGADASALLLPILLAFLQEPPSGEPTTTELGGKQVLVVPSEPVIHAYATGDLVVYVNGPDVFMADLFASLP